MPAPGALLSYGADRDRQQRDGHDPFAKEPANAPLVCSAAVRLIMWEADATAAGNRAAKNERRP